MATIWLMNAFLMGVLLMLVVWYKTGGDLTLSFQRVEYIDPEDPRLNCRAVNIQFRSGASC